MRRYLSKVLLILILISPAISMAASVRVVALFPNKAMVYIDGKRQLLKVGGETVQGVRLISANSRKAVIETNGITNDYFLRRDMGEGIRQPELKVVKINRTNQGQYLTNGLINNGVVRMLVDTGANVVALNATVAKRLGINYQLGEKIQAETAAGVVDAYKVKLDSVAVGGIKVLNVLATVLEGDSSDTVLLGMSYLKNVSLTEKEGVMTLKARY